MLASAHDPTKSFIDNCLAVLTLYLSSLLVSSHYERVRASRRLLTAWRLTLRWWVQEMRRLHSVLARANSDLYNPVGLNLLSPCENAFLFVRLSRLFFYVPLGAHGRRPDIACARARAWSPVGPAANFKVDLADGTSSCGA